MNHSKNMKDLYIKKLTTLAVLAPLAMTTSYAALVAHYTFDNTVNDSSGNGSNGSLVGDATFSTSGIVGSHALSLDGNGDYFQVSDNSTLSITGELTITAWVNANDLSGRGIVDKYTNQGGNQRAYSLHTPGGDGNTRFLISPDGTSGSAAELIGSSGSLSVGEWTHIAAVYDPSSTMRIYVNGVLDAELTSGVPGNIADTTAPLYVGLHFNPANSTNFFNGLIDDVRIYDNALSGTEILALATIPEPSTYAMLLGLGAFVFIAVRRRSAQ